jgi:hypothetical protein
VVIYAYDHHVRLLSPEPLVLDKPKSTRGEEPTLLCNQVATSTDLFGQGVYQGLTDDGRCQSVMLWTDIQSCRVYHWFEGRNMRPKRIRETPHFGETSGQHTVESDIRERMSRFNLWTRLARSLPISRSQTFSNGRNTALKCTVLRQG